MSVSLIVLQCVSAVKYLGPAPLATHTSLSPSFLPFRTALDVLQPQLSFSYPWTPLVPRYQPLSGAFIPFQPHFVSGPHNAVVVSDVAAPAPAQVVDDIEAVDVATETDDGASALGEITVRDHIEALPAIPSSPFRDQSPVIPAGIVQATQPKFVQTIFKVLSIKHHCVLLLITHFQNPKISPILAQRFVINSKVSPVLQEFKANGVELV